MSNKCKKPNSPPDIRQYPKITRRSRVFTLMVRHTYVNDVYKYYDGIYSTDQTFKKPNQKKFNLYKLNSHFTVLKPILLC